MLLVSGTFAASMNTSSGLIKAELVSVQQVYLACEGKR